MLQDSQYSQLPFQRSEQEHRYGDNVHLLADPCLTAKLSRFCDPQCQQPLANQLICAMYEELVRYVVNSEFPQTKQVVKSRMETFHPEGVFETSLIDPNTKVVTLGLARAGTLPSHVCFDFLNHIVTPDNVRQDHISINRKTDDHEQVIGTNLGGMKIGGGIESAFVLLPDPMGATGSTICSTMEIYKNQVQGKAKKFIALHLIVTPEYLKNVTAAAPELEIYSIRLDRGLSSAKVLDSIPGTHWAEERGLNDKQYIVPGAGGVGEIINNSYV